MDKGSIMESIFKCLLVYDEQMKQPGLELLKLELSVIPVEVSVWGDEY